MKSVNLTMLTVKGGASPGAVMKDEANDDVYIVKLGVPHSQSPFYIQDIDKDVADLVSNMSKKACEEKSFFNIAQAISDKYQLPETELVYLKPKEYFNTSNNEVNVRNLDLSLRHKIKLDYKLQDNIDSVFDTINNTEIVHFASKFIENYKDIGEFYNYHLNSNSHSYAKIDTLPSEPLGIGAFYALSCCLGNNDSIGAQGNNAGFNQETNQLIVVDGGNSNLNTDLIMRHIPSANNGSNWLSYDLDLSEEAKKEACNSFINFASLSEQALRKHITNNEQVTEILGESYIKENINKLKRNQQKVIEVFYDEMERLGCLIPLKIMTIKENIDAKNKALNDKLVSSYQNRENIVNTKRPSPTSDSKQNKKPPKKLQLQIFCENKVDENDKENIPDNRALEEIVDNLKSVYSLKNKQEVSKAITPKRKEENFII